MRTLPNTAFYLRMQQDGSHLAQIIDLTDNVGRTWKWTTANNPLEAYPAYQPFPGKLDDGPDSAINLGVSIMNMAMANSGSLLQDLVFSDTFPSATVRVSYVFADASSLGAMIMFEGTIADFGYTRMEIKGTVRDQFKSVSVQWPYYTYQDRCVWKFGSIGCGKSIGGITVSINSIQVNSSNNQFLTVASGYISTVYGNGRFDFGKATITAGPNSGSLRTIKSHTGDLLELSHPLAVRSLANTTLTIHPGCRKTLIADCKSLYNNTNNFLGFPWIPAQEQAYAS